MTYRALLCETQMQRALFAGSRAPRSANDEATCPKWRALVWKMCFVARGCVAYARMNDVYPARAKSLAEILKS